jgi:hypothetical protein
LAYFFASPLTFQAIIIWRDELNDGKALLRNIIDLEATHAGPDAKAPVASPRSCLPKISTINAVPTVRLKRVLGQDFYRA